MLASISDIIAVNCSCSYVLLYFNIYTSSVGSTGCNYQNYILNSTGFYYWNYYLDASIDS
jgi:hypothetical protein